MTSTVPLTLDDLKPRLAPFCKRHGVARLEVFGSFAQGAAQSASDIDLLITFRPEVHLGWNFYALEEELESILGCEVDLLTRRSVELDTNFIRRESILGSAHDVYSE